MSAAAFNGLLDRHRKRSVPSAYIYPANDGLQMLDFQVSKLLQVQLRRTEIIEGYDLYDFLPTNYNSGYKWLNAFISNDTNIFSLSSSDQPLLTHSPGQSYLNETASDWLVSAVESVTSNED